MRVDGPSSIPLHGQEPQEAPRPRAGAEQFLASVGEQLPPLPQGSAAEARSRADAPRQQGKPRDLERELSARERELGTARQSLLDIGRYLNSLMGIVDSAIFVVTPEGVIQTVNEAMAHMLSVSIEELEGLNWSELIRVPSENPPDADRQNDARRLLVESHEAFIKKTALEEVPVLLTGRALYGEHGSLKGVLCTASDQSERRQLESELRHAQKLESVGQLAAGVAHEINTPIQFIGDSVFFLKDAFKDLHRVIQHYQEFKNRLAHTGKGLRVVEEFTRVEREADLEFLAEEIPDAIDRAVEGINRVASIVGAMKKFAHPGGEDRAPQNLNEAIETTLVVSRNEYKYIADIELDLRPIPAVMCNLGDINQVLLNLIVNGAHAIESKNRGTKKRGTITIGTRVEGEHVEISIADTGGGIPSQVRSKVFSPFFTTKPLGKGTGQGLSIARNLIVEKHRGELKFTSTEGAGTTFVITLPLQDPA